MIQTLPTSADSAISDVEPEDVTWFWPGFLPVGKLVVLDGDPGVGKSTVTMDFAARISTGKPFPGCAEMRPPGNVLLMSAEDGISDTVRPRLDASGADNDRVRVVPMEAIPSFPEDLSRLEHEIEEHLISLVVIDPLAAFFGDGTDMHKDQHVRRVLGKIAGLAEKLEVTFLVVRHLNKSFAGNAIHRGGGSIGIAGAARAVLIAGKAPDDPGRCVLAVTKNNLSRKPPSLFFEFKSEVGSSVARIEWGAEAAFSADDLVTPPVAEKKTKRDDAKDFLRTQLADGPVASKELERRALEAGISPVTLNRAGVALKVKKIKSGKPGEAGQQWLWSLPEDDQFLRSQSPFDE